MTTVGERTSGSCRRRIAAASHFTSFAFFLEMKWGFTNGFFLIEIMRSLFFVLGKIVIGLSFDVYCTFYG
jgi:hypothetical protein